MKTKVKKTSDRPEQVTLNDVVAETKPKSVSDGQLIRAWEDYQQKAFFWRAMFLLQLPVAVFALVFAGVVFINRNITLNVPRSPLPG
ncbi:MAG: hypothetical protein NZT61_02230, partial [Deltaproteobacteria bacterium]|nr:hypothetical protein [Deltaproteobacteria bacterium]